MARDDDPSGALFDVVQLLKQANEPEKTLFVLSLGFDPRCLTALRRFIENVGRPTVLALEPQAADAGTDQKTAAMRVENARQLEELVGADGFRLLVYPKVHDEASAGRILAQQLTEAGYLTAFRSVVFDISACPTSLSFPPLAALLDVCGADGGPRNLQVVVAEDPELDGDITKSSLGAPHSLAGFAARRTEGHSGIKVWTPVLGLSGAGGLAKAAEYISPGEVCPVIPFPSVDPRMPDRVLAAHHTLLVDQYQVRQSNLMFAAENNPFDLYRKLVAFDQDYQSALKELGGATVTVSMHGSKLLSVGALLAAYERQLHVVAVRANTYVLDPDRARARLENGGALTCLWLRGDPYGS